MQANEVYISVNAFLHELKGQKLSLLIFHREFGAISERFRREFIKLFFSGFGYQKPFATEYEGWVVYFYNSFT